MTEVVERLSDWKPILEDDDDERPCRTIVKEILEGLEEHPQPAFDLGKALLHAYLGVSTGNRPYRETAEALVSDQVRRLESQSGRVALYGGVVGVGWLSAHIDSLFDCRDDDFYCDLDFALLELCRNRASDNYDLIFGWVGIGVYFLERLPSSLALDGLKRVVSILESLAEHSGDAVTWYTRPDFLPEWQRELCPAGYYNIGLAHGVPGVLSFLAEVQRAVRSELDVREMLLRGSRWLLNQRLPGGGYETWIAPGRERTRGRLAWCYGELGVAVSLLRAARALDDRLLEAQAVDVARDAAQRRTETGVRDAGLCHGAAGNAHVFNRLYQATRDDLLLDAGRFWFRETVKLRMPGLGIAGYRSWMHGPGRRALEEPWKTDPAFLTGAPGIALALLAGMTPVEPNWDRLLLTRLDPVPSS